jgi:Ca2+-binding EF-hand superfamily protein
VSEFYNTCFNASPTKTRTKSPNKSTKGHAKVKDGSISLEQLKLGLTSLGMELPLSEFSMFICAFRVTKGKYISLEDFCHLFNKST